MARGKKAAGGQAAGEKDFGSPRRDWESDLKDKPTNRGAPSNVSKEAEEKKRGGRAKRRDGGGVKHHERGKNLAHAKHVGQVSGDTNKHAGRMPRKSGGRAGTWPFSAARAGTPPKDHKVTRVD